MKKRPTSYSNTEQHRQDNRLWWLQALMWVCLCTLPASSLFAQGRSIPTSSAVQEEVAAKELSDDELPEGVRYRYPLLNGMSVSFNLFPPVMNLFGKDYGSYEGGLTLDLHHRFFPQAHAGVGYCNAKNEDFVRYHSKMTPFFKAGMLYNFKYNELKPNDFYGAFVRFGYAYSKADVSNLYFADAIWDQAGPFSIEDMKFNSVWMELGGFIKVEVVKHISLGWDLSVKPFLHRGDVKQGVPYYIPGYGTTTTKLGFGFHIYYDLW